MPLNYRLVTGPAAEPVSLTLAKAHCAIDFTDKDDLIGMYITAAREWCEQFTQRAIFNQTWEVSLDAFPYGDYRSTVPMDQRNPWNYSSYWTGMAIRLPVPRCVSVTSIVYLDATATQQTLDPTAYYADAYSEPARIVPVGGTTWPVGQLYQPGSILVTYVAGMYGDGVTVNLCPQRIVMAVLLIVAHWLKNAEATTELQVKEVPLGIESLLRPLRFESFGNYQSGF